MTQNAAIVGSHWLMALKLLTTMHSRPCGLVVFAMKRDGEIFFSKKMVMLMLICIKCRKTSYLI